MKKILLFLVLFVPFISYAEENQNIEKRIEKIEENYKNYESTLETTKKIYDYTNLIYLVLFSLTWFFWIILNYVIWRIKKINEDRETISLLTQVELFRIESKKFLSLSNWDWKTTELIDFNDYIALSWKNLIDYFLRLNKKNTNLENFLLSDDFIALWDAYYHNRQFDEAISYYNKALVSAKFNSQIYYNIGFSYLEKRLSKNWTKDSKEQDSFEQAILFWKYDFKNYIWFVISLANSINIDENKIIENLKTALDLNSAYAKNMLEQYKKYLSNIDNILKNYNI